ncbi:MAG TPA: thermonuclease family protein [Rhodocyclaceae bacterium]|nr:thermonuclease family protein [Rhodocyclaceae bacterium]
MATACKTLLFLCALCATSACAQPRAGIVTIVTGGDTFTLTDDGQRQQRVRLAGIAAPDAATPAGMRSKAELSALVFSRRVTVSGSRIDRDGYLIGKVMVVEGNCEGPACPNNRDVGLAQVASGMARWQGDDGELTPKEREDYGIAEFKARSQRLGLWVAERNPPRRNSH